MKKVILLCFSVFFLIGSLIIPKGDAHASTTEQEIEDVINDMVYAFENTELKLNIENPESEIVEEEVYNENGEHLGTFGMEIVSIEDEIDPTTVNSKKNDISTFSISLPNAKTLIKGTMTVKVYWYAATINYEFYAKVAKNSSGKAYIVDKYDENYFVVPPVVVSSDKLETIQKTETSSSPAQARYTLNLSTYVGGATKLWIFVKAAEGYFWTGGN
ncbi:MAG: hypothetical protein ACI35O_12845 [Bacillaceae bacterium]